MKKYFMCVKQDKGMHAGVKAVDDCNDILLNMGYEPIDMFMLKENDNVFVKLKKYVCIFGKFFIKSRSIIVIQYPLSSLKPIYLKVLKVAKKIKKLQYVFWIHDLSSLRYKNDREQNKKIDAQMFELADYLISHNKQMTEYIIQQNYSKDKIVDLEIFDYLGNIKNRKIEFKPVLNIAGNLDEKKCKYLNELNEIDKEIKFNLYGINFNKRKLFSTSIDYKGIFPPEDVPNQFEAGFGLVWDGDSIERLEGDTGKYLKYNNPHKLSLYLVSGLPVVINKEAAEAEYIEKNNVGIVVEKISDFKTYYEKMTEEEYSCMLQSVKKCSEKINSGYYLKTAISEIEKRMCD